MALTLYWGSGSPFSWRVLLALEHKRLPYESHLLHFDKQEHQSPQMLKTESARPAAGVEGRRLRGVRVGRGSLLPRCEISAGADLRHESRGGRRHHARDLRISGLRRAVAVEDRERHLRRHGGRCDRRADGRDARGRARGAHDRRTFEQGALDRRRKLFRHRHGDLPLDPAAAARPGQERGRRARRALSADGKQLSGAGALDPAHRIACPATSAPTRRIGARNRLRSLSEHSAAHVEYSRQAPRTSPG